MVDRVDTYAPPKSPEGTPSPDQARQMAEHAKHNHVSVEPEPKDAQQADRPAWLPEKFKSPEDLAKSYAELEKRLGSKEAPPKRGAEDLKIEPKEAAKGDTKAAEQVVEKAGLDMAALNKEYADKGELTAESLAALKAVGIDKAIVDAYIEGQAALQERRMGDLYSVAGGQERFDQMHAWSAQNLPPAEQAAVNKALDSGDHNAIKLAFQGVFAKWQAAGQDEPTGQITGNRSAQTADVYADRSELQRDIASKEYQTSEAFRQKVMAKLGRSGI